MRWHFDCSRALMHLGSRARPLVVAAFCALAACATRALPRARVPSTTAVASTTAVPPTPPPVAPRSIDVDLHYHPTMLRITELQHLPALVLSDGVVIGTNDPIGVGRVDRAGQVRWWRELGGDFISDIERGADGEVWVSLNDRSEARLYRLGPDGADLGGPWRFTSRGLIYVTSPLVVAGGDVVFSVSMVGRGLTLPDGRELPTPAGASLLVRMQMDGTMRWMRRVEGSSLLHLASDGVSLHVFGETNQSCTIEGVPIAEGGGTPETSQAFWIHLDGDGQMLASARVAEQGQSHLLLDAAIRPEGVLLVWTTSPDLMAYQWLSPERGTPLGPMITVPTDDAQGLLMDDSAVALVWDGIDTGNLSILALGRDAAVPLARLTGEPERQLVPGALWQDDGVFRIAAMSTPRANGALTGPPQLVLMSVPEQD